MKKLLAILIIALALPAFAQTASCPRCLSPQAQANMNNAGAAIGAGLARRHELKEQAKEGFCMNAAPNFEGGSAWCAKFLYEHPILGIPYMSDELMKNSIAACGAQQMKGKYSVPPPIGSKEKKFPCEPLGRALLSNAIARTQ